jgi:hypothetical protein
MEEHIDDNSDPVMSQLAKDITKLVAERLGEKHYLYCVFGKTDGNNSNTSGVIFSHKANTPSLVTYIKYTLDAFHQYISHLSMKNPMIGLVIAMSLRSKKDDPFTTMEHPDENSDTIVGPDGIVP